MAKLPKIKLENPPLKEVIFEVRWKNSAVSDEVKKKNQLLAGSFFAKINKEYAYFEPLPAAQMGVIDNDNFAGFAMYRFRPQPDKWPLIQIGSGMLSVNDTEKYQWKDFKERCVKALLIFLEIYDISSAIETISLRYINALPFDYKKDDILEFLKKDLDVSISLPNNIFTACEIEKRPETFNTTLSFTSSKPAGNLNFQVSSGLINKTTESLVWHSSFVSKKGALPQNEKELEVWLEQTHEKLEQWFLVFTNKYKGKFK